MEQPTTQQVILAREVVMANEGYLHIKRCPKKTVAEFLSFANSDDWDGHWGLAFKHVWDFYNGLNPRTNEAIMQEIEALRTLNEELLQRVSKLEQAEKVVSGKKPRVMIDGTLR
jgi:hypothetical protein